MLDYVQNLPLPVEHSSCFMLTLHVKNMIIHHTFLAEISKRQLDLQKRLRDNQFQGYASKFHALLSTDKLVHVNIGTTQIENTQNERLLGITIFSKLSFDKHIQQICSRASAKLKALARIVPFMNITKMKRLMNAFFNAQFCYCPFTWMFHSRKLNNKINKLHERCLQIVYNNNTSTYEELLETDNSVSVHFQNVQALAIELCKVVNGFSPNIMKDVFPLYENSSYNNRNKRTFHSRHIKTAHFGSETLSHLAHFVSQFQKR